MFPSTDSVNISDLIVVTCSLDELPNVMNGKFKTSDCTGRRINDTCTLTCNDDHHHTSPDEQTICQDKGGGKPAWSSGTYSCHECKPSWQGHSYTWVNTKMSWADADTHCRFISAHLVYINDAEENSFVKSLTNCDGHVLPPESYASIGLIYAGNVFQVPSIAGFLYYTDV
ncbi:hypothetical protein HOLleu_22569 [Holothuria leucospilota]|uniref:C-type lectin domain-containing protein n=1 Tax=Holothuria leucospilota TaxID=206669 RepID=A0A9Q1H799_HOLLE|nr:hypothetical protein HOLleu_22569 [Holothuria leucospilota]